MNNDITLNKQDVIKYLKETRANMYHSVAKARRRHSFKCQRPSEQAMQEVSWQSQLIALDIAVVAMNLVTPANFAAKNYKP